MKKITALVTALLLLCCASVSLADQVTVSAETYPLYSLAKLVAGDAAEVTLGAAEDAAIVFCVGSREAAENQAIVSVTELLDVQGEDTDALTIPVNCMIMASYLADALSAVNPDSTVAYQANLGALVTELSELDLALRAAVTADTAISCADGSMAFFAAEYGCALADDGVVLSTYNNPSEELMEFSYVELMAKNLEALQK